MVAAALRVPDGAARLAYPLAPATVLYGPNLLLDSAKP